MSLVLPLDRAADRRLTGAKAENLGRLIRAGLPVPPGVVVTTEAFAAFLGHHREWCTEQIAGLQRRGPGAVAEVVREIRGRLEPQPLPEPLVRAVTAAVRELGADTALAVRSSAVAEDLETASFAGQYESFLDLRGPEAVLRAVKDCYLAAFSERVLAYRLRHGLLGNGLEMAVIIQHFVAADAAGVLFTRHPRPHAGEEVLLVEVVRGCGEAVVSGRRTPWRYLLRRTDGEIVQRLPGSDPREPLDATSAIRLAALARRVEALFGAAQDMEWAAAGGRILLLQSRPIVTTFEPGEPTPHTHAPPRAWSCRFVAELAPGPVSPLAWSLVVPAREAVLRRLRRAGRGASAAEPGAALFDGRLYDDFSALAAGLAGTLPAARAAITGCRLPEVRSAAHDAETEPPRRGALGRGLDLCRFLAWRAGIHLRARLTRHRLARHPASGADLSSLPAARLREWLVEIHRCARLLLMEHYLMRLGVELVHAAACAALGQGEDPAYRRWLLARLATGRTSAAARMGAAFPDAAPRARVAPVGPEAAAELRAAPAREWLDAHGHHGPYGPAACGPTWREDPRLLVQLAARMAEASGPPTAVSAREAASAEPGLMPPWPRRGVASLLLHHVRRGLRLRLALEEDLARATSLLRELALEAGRRLRRAGVVGASEDALLLPVGDLALLVPLRLEWPSARRLRLLERHRRRRRAYVSRPDPPPAFVARGRERIPSHAGESWPLHGLAAAPGSATARVRVLRNPEDLAEMRPGEILVCRALPPGLAPFLRLSAGLVMETGTALSTAAALAREYRLPAVVGLLDATLRLRTGDLLRLDGLHGVVERLDS